MFFLKISVINPIFYYFFLTIYMVNDMKNITQYRAVFLKKDGSVVPYPIVLGDNHQIIIEDFCNKEGYSYPSIDTIIKNNDIVFYHANQGIVLVYLPNTLTDEQYFALDLLSLSMNDISYLEAQIDGVKEDFILKEKIGENFSKQIIQYYFEKKDKKR